MHAGNEALRVRSPSSNSGQFVRHDPSLPLVIRADECRRVKGSDRVSVHPSGGLAVGSRRCSLYVELYA